MHDVLANAIAADCQRFVRETIDIGDRALLPDESYERLVQTVANLADQVSQLERALESPQIEIDEFTVMNLVTFVRRLARQLRKSDPNNKPALDALSYLNRHGVTGDLLRAASDTGVEH